MCTKNDCFQFKYVKNDSKLKIKFYSLKEYLQSDFDLNLERIEIEEDKLIIP